jgi:hypothetical protein
MIKMIEKHTIQTPRQSNGLWGTPLYLRCIDGNIIFKDEYKNVLVSAILMSFAECKNEYFSLKIDKNEYFILKTDKTHFYKLQNFGLINNTLYFLPTESDKLLFNRLLKLKSLKLRCNLINI